MTENSTQKKPIIIIGSGLAGYVLAKEFRKLNQSTPLVIITNSEGHFYSKPLLSTALTHQRSPKDLITTDVEKIATELRARILACTTVTAIKTQQQKIVIDNESSHYAALVLAVGAEPIHLPLQEKVYSVNNLEDYVLFRKAIEGKKRIGIIGAGLVGCEFANDLVNGGYEVDVFALSSYPMDRFVPEPIGRVLQHGLAEKGVRWHLNQKFGTHDCNLLFSAVGLRPNVTLAKQAGITVNQGIVVDRYLQTNCKNIYALGDCAEVNGLSWQFVAPLMQCARALAKTLAGEPTQVSYPIMPIIVKTPACPLVFYPPVINKKGEWKIEGKGKDWQALFYDETNKLQGFALTGEKTRDKIIWSKQILPPS